VEVREPGQKVMPYVMGSGAGEACQGGFELVDNSVKLVMNRALPEGGVNRGGGVSACLLVMHSAEGGRGGVTAPAMAAIARGGWEAHRRGPPLTTGLVPVQIAGCAIKPDMPDGQRDEGVLRGEGGAAGATLGKRCTDSP
jgi:hypothetical protein